MSRPAADARRGPRLRLPALPAAALGAYVRQYVLPAAPILLLAQPLAFGVLTVGSRAADASVPLTVTAAGAGALSMWTLLLGGASWSLWSERQQGRLRLVLASPTPVAALFALYLAAAALVSLASVSVAVLVVPALFGDRPDGGELVRAVPGLLALAVAVLATGLALTPLFVGADGAVVWFDGLIYPVAVLGGFFAPVAALPRPFELLAGLLPPYWAFRLLTALVGGGPLGPAAVGLVLTVLGCLAGYGAGMRLVTNRIRVTGSVGLG
ncbi:MAG: ABC transporter permease [Mycobacteriales bacterium]